MNSSNKTLMTREPVVAGQFYPGSAIGLKNELQRLFKSFSPHDGAENTLGIISPHAGYIFSGTVAASGYMHVDPVKNYNNVFLIGSSHHYDFDGASVYTRGDYLTPLGKVLVNIKLSNELIAVNNYISDRSDAQQNEHSIEVQLPFLQFWLKKEFQIVPVIIATNKASTCRKIAGSLLPYFNASNLFIISTDFSHYPNYDDSNRVDKMTAEAILSNDPKQLLKIIEKNDMEGIPGLSTSLCGWTSVLTLMYITQKMQGIRYTLLDYKNSGDAPYHDKSRVVGYCALSIAGGN